MIAQTPRILGKAILFVAENNSPLQNSVTETTDRNSIHTMKHEMAVKSWLLTMLSYLQNRKAICLGYFLVAGTKYLTSMSYRRKGLF